MCYYIIQISLRLYVILTSLPGSTFKDLGGGASVLYLALLRLLTAPAPRNGRLDFHHVTVSRARALECALLCRAAQLRDRPSMRGPENPRRLRPATGRYRTRSFRAIYVASSLVATPKNQRKPDSASLRSFAEQRYLARCVAPRDLSLLPCCYSFLIQGKNTCENILRATICTAV